MPHERATLLPGVLALFGFQLLAVFSSGFQEGLDRAEQQVHLAAIALVALAIAALVMPAAYLRGADPSAASAAVVDITRRSLLAAMLALAIAIPLEVFLAACVVLRGPVALVVGIVALALFLSLWFFIPLARVRAH